MEKPGLPLIAAFAAALAASILFGYLANDVLARQDVHFDPAVRDAIHGWTTPRLTWLMRGITQLGSVPVLIGLGIVLAWRLLARGRGRAAVLLFVVPVGGELLDQALKFTFQRPRPEAFFDVHAMGYSFPSGHSVASCCFYGVVAAILTRHQRSRAARAAIWTVAALLVLLVGVSRIYLGVHYPSDVVAGYAAAVVWVAAVRAGYEVWLRRRAGPTKDSNS